MKQNNKKLDLLACYQAHQMHWIALVLNYDKVTYFDSFELAHISKEIKKFISKKISLKIFIEYKHTVQ